MRQNRKIVLDSYCEGLPRPENFRFIEAPAEAPSKEEVLVRTHYLSLDPFPRLRMSKSSSFGPPLPLGETVIGRGVGQVVESASSRIAPGEFVAGELGWQAYSCVPAETLRRVDPSIAPLTAHLGVLGPSGITAYLVLYEAGRAAAGDTVLVSAAAGAVGSAAGQIAKLTGCYTVGTVIGDQQREFVGALGFDDVLDCGEQNAFAANIAGRYADQVDVFLDGVGGEFHEAVLPAMALHSRIVVYGFISEYNAPASEREFGRMIDILEKRITVKGFLVGDYGDRFDEVTRQLAAWLAAGKLTETCHVTDGFDNVPEAFARLFDGAPPGKQLVRIVDDSKTGEEE